mmetsp:Transcript_26429/g.39227  ORF Transcript_26429/g.39227 Transcript_26429/m.39227 type:complete len:423 (+) Transcript_26429:270-1538(+)|eukprot:CAMPEP_0185039630 /NCGR_PEP_ID=MMETSP1103-20130426/36682_1 /TAXON_ID=36769 /ORGANISM="Paraphysomonas bandaiensis, Strain Caron Lab Isolate" /LENGTH=422 /DNA_ID=CAMNT_0027578593 /DNA_START=185 /DNA_END=1453 /DNA_ORIENTATION=-
MPLGVQDHLPAVLLDHDKSNKFLKSKSKKSSRSSRSVSPLPHMDTAQMSPGRTGSLSPSRDTKEVPLLQTSNVHKPPPTRRFSRGRIESTRSLSPKSNSRSDRLVSVSLSPRREKSNMTVHPPKKKTAIAAQSAKHEKRLDSLSPITSQDTCRAHRSCGSHNIPPIISRRNSAKLLSSFTPSCDVISQLSPRESGKLMDLTTSLTRHTSNNGRESDSTFDPAIEGTWTDKPASAGSGESGEMPALSRQVKRDSGRIIELCKRLSREASTSPRSLLTSPRSDQNMFSNTSDIASDVRKLEMESDPTMDAWSDMVSMHSQSLFAYSKSFCRNDSDDNDDTLILRTKKTTVSTPIKSVPRENSSDIEEEPLPAVKKTIVKRYTTWKPPEDDPRVITQKLREMGSMENGEYLYESDSDDFDILSDI